MFRLNLVLLFIAIACALSVVTTQYKGRKLYIEMEKEKRLEKQLNVEWGRLQLEQATWAAHARVEQVATTRLNMMQPDNKHKRVVLPEGVFMPQTSPEGASSMKPMAAPRVPASAAAARAARPAARPAAPAASRPSAAAGGGQ